MGRPIASKYFGNRNTDGSGVGGEQLAIHAGNSAVVYSAITSGTGYYTANAVATFSAPQITGGTLATGTPVLNGSGNVTGVLVTNVGSGYTSAPSVVITGANTSPAAITPTITTSSRTDAITVSAYLSVADNGSSAVASDIIKQTGARSYRVQNAQGSGKVKLVTSSPAAGECRITATDSDSGTYYVKKLESRTVTLLPVTGSQFLEDQQVVWTLDSAEAGVSVVIANN
jgi:hypothetical protein